MELVKGLKIRTEILKYSLLIEKFISILLSNLININDSKASKSLGNKSGNLSFNQKVHLLIDIKALDNKEKSKFTTFMSVRNQFMHNFEADSYENCYKNIDGADKFLFKTYNKDEELSKENQLENVTKQLADDVIKITSKLWEKVEEKVGEKIKSEMLEEYKSHSIKAISEIEKIFNSAYDEKAEKGEKTINISELKKLGSKISGIYYSTVLKEMSEDEKK